MTYDTAVQLVQRQDLNATLCVAGRLTHTDLEAMHQLMTKARAEDIEEWYKDLEEEGLESR